MLSTQDKAKMEEALEKMGPLFQDGPLKNYSSEDLSILYSIAYTFYQGKDYEEALPVFERLASSAPFSQKNWMGLGACWQMKENYQEALQAWAMASILNDSDPIPHFHAAECYYALGNIQEGKKAIATCKNLLTTEDMSLLTKCETLESSWKQEEKQGA